MSNFIKLVGQHPRTVLIPRPLGGAVPHRLIMLTKLLGCPVAEIVLRSMRNITQIIREFADPDVIAILNKSYMSLAQKIPNIVPSRDLPVTKVEPTFRVGGFANVHRAELYGRPVAVKMPRWYVRTSTDTNAEDNRKLKDFIHELVIMELLGSHPNILQIIGSSTYQGVPCLVLPWMDNGNIAEYIPSKSASPGAGVCCRKKLTPDIARGMVHLKRSGIIHGDLKGSNILINDNGDAVIADFGLSTFPECRSDWNFAIGCSNTEDYENSGVGTLRWMAPELLLPEDFDRSTARPTFASDIFAFGMTVYEIYSGRIPYYEDNICMVISHITKGNRPQRPTGIPDDIWHIIQKCWTHQPATRPTIEAVDVQLREVMV